ncbi:MAG: OmpA family protein [Desulfobacteraceae bacterium]
MLLLTACSATSSKQEAELVENGFTAMSGGDYSTAEYLLYQALALNDKNPYTLLNLGVICQETRRYDKAREFYQSVIDLNSSKTAVSSNVQGYSGKKLSDIARINMDNLPPVGGSDSRIVDRNDLDADGVPNDLDRCDGTPTKAEVMANGCWALKGIFPPGRTDIGFGVRGKLDRVVMVLRNNPSLRIEIQGHTDDSGTFSANLRLSKERAKSVMQYLIKRGIEPERLQWAGYGQTRPVATNDTRDGREQNRRVEFSPIP